MKLLVFVTEYSAADAAVDALVEQGFRVTRLASTGGFLRKGNTTLLVGVEDSAVDQAVALARRAAPGSLVITLDLERYERI
ncbi:MAG TPA: cyclic-di-AMP receptor [Kouleothrix sp.]|uniref:cyclic-di-AMP receptor n=1 Tax=Kouleothrix sp. TaxID=2779161 RepID=UPI002C60877C|nr:cyclic-di-AMP receptor [Kouleothrix sp.]HRC77535.1 cyclic-di-AMP receptor [Kouleothrix sp.]